MGIQRLKYREKRLGWAGRSREEAGEIMAELDELKQRLEAAFENRNTQVIIETLKEIHAKKIKLELFYVPDSASTPLYSTAAPAHNSRGGQAYGSEKPPK